MGTEIDQMKIQSFPQILSGITSLKTSLREAVTTTLNDKEQPPSCHDELRQDNERLHKVVSGIVPNVNASLTNFVEDIKKIKTEVNLRVLPHSREEQVRICLSSSETEKPHEEVKVDASSFG